MKIVIAFSRVDYLNTHKISMVTFLCQIKHGFRWAVNWIREGLVQRKRTRLGRHGRPSVNTIQLEKDENFDKSLEIRHDEYF